MIKKTEILVPKRWLKQKLQESRIGVPEDFTVARYGNSEDLLVTYEEALPLADPVEDEILLIARDEMIHESVAAICLRLLSEVTCSRHMCTDCQDNLNQIEELLKASRTESLDS